MANEKRPSRKFDDLQLEVAKDIKINILDYIDLKKYQGFQNRINDLPISKEEQESLLNDFNILFGENSLSTTSKKNLITKITGSMFNKIIEVITQDLHNVKIRNFGTFRLGIHQRWNSWLLTFDPATTNFKDLLKMKNVIDDPALVDEYLIQQENVKKAIEARKEKKGKNSR